MKSERIMVRIPLFPEYGKTKQLMLILEGKEESAFKSMWNAIWNLRGTPQSQVTWQDPDEWIPNRLSNNDREFAELIWNGTNKIVNHAQGT